MGSTQRMEKPRSGAAMTRHSADTADYGWASARPRRFGLVAASTPTRGTSANIDFAPQLVSISLAAADVTAAFASLAVVVVVAHSQTVPGSELSTIIPWLACALAGVLLHFASHGHYTHRKSRGPEFGAIVSASAAGLLASTLAAYFVQNSFSPGATTAWAVVAGWLSLPIFLAAARALTRCWLTAAKLWQIPVIVVDTGDSPDDSVLPNSVHSLGYSIVARIAAADIAALLRQSERNENGLGHHQFGGGGWRRLLQVHGARMVILAFDPADPNRPAPRIIDALARERVPVCVMCPTFGLPLRGCAHTWFVGHEAIMFSHAFSRLRPISLRLKAGADVTIAATALLILLPLFALLAIIIRADGGPAFFAHPRIGIGGRTFNCLKFRTMMCDSDAVLQRLLETDSCAAQEWAATQKLRADPRVTWIGRILRKTSLDELPQLINVLRLEMSLVGPRPIVSREICRYADDIAYYYDTRPGITGLWQVSGRNDTSYARRVELDRWYVKNWSLWQDLAILARTVPAVLSGRGAS
jgi:undecaprenyl-phosphate galactose phosphotransferase